jgi:hypothetical protein
MLLESSDSSSCHPFTGSLTVSQLAMQTIDGLNRWDSSTWHGPDAGGFRFR